MEVGRAVIPAVSKLPQWITLSSKFAPYASTVVFLAPIPTILSRKLGGLPLLPYSSMVANCFVWLVYGLLIKEKKVWTTNAFGGGLGLFYCNEFRKSLPKASSEGTISKHMYAVSIVALLTSFFALVLPQSLAKTAVGAEGVLLCVLMFASPLATLKQVIENKSARSIPLPFTLACLVNCLLWSIVGWFELNDFMIYTPNLLGLAFSLAQTSLKLVYKSTADYEKKKGSESDAILPVRNCNGERVSIFPV
jgi:solute carrier family 50 protein (sugar transporter)